MSARDQRWVSVANVTNTFSAAAITTRLESEGVPSRVERSTQILGEVQLCAVVVPPELESQAKGVLAAAHFTDDELAFLAIGQLSCEDAKE